MSIPQNLRDLAERWAGARAAERANFQPYLSELCEALEVEKPRPAGSGYEFEYRVRVVNRDGSETTNFVDCFKRGHFILEAKDQGTSADDTILLRKAYGQARAYTAAADGGPPPYAMVMDVGRTLLVWDRWSGTYGGFNAASRINLATLADNADAILLLRDIFERPQARDPNIRSAAVTKEIAEQLAELASALETRGFEQERIARFLIRCVFTMFSEDTGLIPDAPFTHAIDEIGFSDPDEFAVSLASLWKAMDEGSRFGLKKFLRFNGHFFRDQEVIPLTREDLTILRRAAAASWEAVEPSIMGTLLVRALDPEERHRLGAEFTPREYVERVVRPTVEEPIRERWTAVQAEVLQLRDSSTFAERTRRDRDRLALERLRGFHEWLRSLRFLDPACGSGNFLYVTLAIVKQIELEVLRGIEEITGAPELAVEEVGPWQFHGIEVKLWAREIAELTLWIGYHQWWRRTHGHTQPPEPVLRDTGTLEWRDAILAWDDTRMDPERERPDPTPRITHPVTGNLIPDPEARLPYVVYETARPAAWPEAHFIIGNPPYIGGTRMREALGDGYVDALRQTYAEVPNGADLVMYWWYRAAEAVASGHTLRAGLITTNSITQSRNRKVIEAAAKDGVRVCWAIKDHPWVDATTEADVRVAMTVLARDCAGATLVEVDQASRVTRTITTSRLNADLSTEVDVTSASNPLRANAGISSMGVALYGAGFLLSAEEAEQVAPRELESGLVRPYLTGKDLAASRNRDLFVIDFGLMPEDEARSHAVLYDLVRSRVKPDRDAHNRKSIRENWWQFGWPRPVLRDALRGLPRYIATPYVSKHRFFTFLPAHVAPDDTIIAIASSDPAHLAVLSSSIHVEWSLAAGSRLGVGNDPRYNKSKCFDPFPFPLLAHEVRDKLTRIALELDDHRRAAIARGVTMTGIYNVLQRIRAGETLTIAERQIHDIAACGVLRDMHDRLDALVADAYGWSWPMPKEEILESVVDLHRTRIQEERNGVVRWLRPEYQVGRFGEATGQDAELELAADQTETASAVVWPSLTLDQIGAIQALLAQANHTTDSIARQFAGARRDIVGRHLETLVLMGEVRALEGGVYEAVRQVP